MRKMYLFSLLLLWCDSQLSLGGNFSFATRRKSSFIALSDSVEDFSSDRESVLRSKLELTKHAYSMLFSMNYIGAIAWKKLNMQGGQNEEAHAHPAKLAAWGLAWKAAYGQFPDKPDVRESLLLHNTHPFTQSLQGAKVGSVRGQFFRISRQLFPSVASLIYDHFYQACFAINLQTSIFSSSEAWNRFKVDALREYEPEILFFLLPWIDDLDRIVSVIEGLDS